MLIGAYRDQQQGYEHPLQLFMSKKVRKEEKPHGENPPSRKEKEQKIEQNAFNIYLYSLEWAEWNTSVKIIWWRICELHDHALQCRICKKEEESLLVDNHTMKSKN